MTTSQATVYYKTEAGLEEMQSRQAGLNPRVRQLLILVDGKRNLLELQKLMAFAELEEFVALLELKGLIAPDPQDLVAGPARNASGLSQMFRQSMTASPGAGLLEAGADVAVTDRREPDSPAPAWADTLPGAPELMPADGPAEIQAGAPAAVSLEADSGLVAVQERFLLDRQHLAALLADAVGPMSSDMCRRIEQAVRPGELSELFVASLTVVELMSGRKAADRFVEKLKSMGWDY